MQYATCVYTFLATVKLPMESPETALRDLSNLHHRYLTKAGAKFKDANG